MTRLALPAPTPWRGHTVEPTTRRVAALGLVTAAVTHTVAVADHRDSFVAAGFFVGAVLLQLWTALAYLRRPTRRLGLLIMGTTALLLGIWAASRTVGIAIGHAHGPESVAILDRVAVTAEVVALVAVTSTSGLDRWRQLSLAVAVSMAVAGTALFAASRPADDHHTADHSTTPPAAGMHHLMPANQVERPALSRPAGEPPDAGTVDAPVADHEHKTCHEPGCEDHAHP